jgi:hypothetical protein
MGAQKIFCIKIVTNEEDISLVMIFVRAVDVTLMLSQTMFLLLFLVIINGIRYRYQIINKLLEFEMPTKNQILIQLASLYLNLFDLITLVMKVFSFPIMFSIGYNISGGVFSLYEVFSVLSRPNVTRQQIGFCMIVTAWLPNAVLSCLIEASCCVAAADEGMKTMKILKHVLNREDDEKVKRKLKLFLLQVFHSRPVFSCGLFEFNWKILGIVR